MLAQKNKATATAVTSNNVNHKQFYQRQMPASSVINELLGNLLFASQNPGYLLSERFLALNQAEELIRLKIDLGLLKGGSNGC